MKLAETEEFKFVIQKIVEVASSVTALDHKLQDFKSIWPEMERHEVALSNLKKLVKEIDSKQERILSSVIKLEALYRDIANERKGLSDRLKKATGAL